MLKHKEIKQRIAEEIRYDATKMQEEMLPVKKLFYFSAIFGEIQRSLNWEWNTELALIHTITSHVYQQINNQMQNPVSLQTLPINWPAIFDKLTLSVSDLATYFEKSEDDVSKEELYQILCSLAEIGYVVTGNGSYLYDKGVIKL